MSLFSEQLRETGRTAEDFAYSLLVQLGGNVVNVSELKEWQAKDVDYLVTFDGKQQLLIEVKSDKHISKTRNFNFEVLRFYHATGEQRMGWSHFSAADYFFVWDSVSRFYVFEAVNVRKQKDTLLNTNRPNVSFRLVVSDRTTSTLNLLIPIDRLTYTVWCYQYGEWTKEKAS